MPSILTHPAVPLCLGLVLGPKRVSGRLMLAGVVAAIAPDFDVAAFKLGIEYAHQLGHRGASHSIAIALVFGAIAALFAGRLRARPTTAFLFVASAAASHGLLDMLTNGGLGVAYFWPLSGERYFFPTRIIEVSPLRLSRFVGPAGAAVVLSELLWVWLPCVALVAGRCLFRSAKNLSDSS